MYLTLSDHPAARERRTRDPRRTRVRVPRVVVTLGFVSLLTDVSSESVAAVLPLYLTAYLGLSTVAFGVIDGLHQGVSALVRLAGGWAADRSDHPKWVAALGYGLSCVARVGLLFATGAGAVAAIVTADRIGKGVRTAPRDAMIATAAPASDLGRAFGVHRALDTVGAALGPLMAFVVLWAIPDGYLTVMAASLAFAFLGVTLLALLVPDLRTGRRGPAAAPAPVRWAAVTDPRLVRLLVVAGLLGVLTVGDAFLYLALVERSDFAAMWFPLLYVGTNVAFLALAVPMGRLSDRLGRSRMLVLGHVALAVGYLCAASPGTGWSMTLAALASLGLFYAATDGALAAVASRAVPPAVRASGIAAAQTVVALARLVSSMSFGVLWFAVGPQAALVGVAVALGAVIPFAWRQVRTLDLRTDPV